MPFSLYDATVPAYLRILRSLALLLEKAEIFCLDHGLAPEAIVDARIIDDMRPFSYQVKAAVMHSAGAVRAVQQGTFSPDPAPAPVTFGDLRWHVAEATMALGMVRAEAINVLDGQPMAFVDGPDRIDFTVDTFFVHFSLPNFYFHATTAYDILRMKGLAIGKSDFRGE